MLNLNKNENTVSIVIDFTEIKVQLGFAICIPSDEIY